MSTNKKQLTTWEASCIITGYGIGAGVLSMPYMAARNGIILSTLILILALLASYVLHLMIAEIAFKEGNGGQIISCLNRFLFFADYPAGFRVKLLSLLKQGRHFRFQRAFI